MNVKKFAWYIVVLALLQPAISRRKSKGKCVGQYTCQRPTVSGGSSTCICIDQSQFCNGATDCPNAEDEQNCDRTWAGWMGWNDCSRSCGGGHRVRYRTCSNPVPSGKGPYCVGKAAEVSDCGTEACPVNGGWTSWKGWTNCDKTCGGGMRTRVRTCTCPPQSGEGFDCKGIAEEHSNCAMTGCPVDGVWSTWSYCPCIGDNCDHGYGGGRVDGVVDSAKVIAKSYGGGGGGGDQGTRTRYRSCTMPRPSLGGAYCSGEPVEEDKECNIEYEECHGGHGK